MQTRTEGAATQVPRQKRGVIGRFANMSAQRRQQAYYAILFIFPGLAVYLIFMIYPFLNTLHLSFTNWNGVAESKDWVGVSNYARMFGDGAVLESFYNNVIWVILGTILPVVIGLFLALILWSGAYGSLLFRTLFFLPFILPLVVVGIVWQWLYNPMFGPINKILSSVGLDQLSRGWLGDPNSALYAVLVAGNWGTFGFVVVVLLAALQNVGRSTLAASMRR